MKGFAFLAAGIPVLVLAWSAWGRAYRLLRQDAKDSAALKLADSWPPFARAYGQAQRYAAYLCTADKPWRRPEHGNRSVYILRGGA